MPVVVVDVVSVLGVGVDVEMVAVLVADDDVVIVGPGGQYFHVEFLIRKSSLVLVGLVAFIEPQPRHIIPLHALCCAYPTMSKEVAIVLIRRCVDHGICFLGRVAIA